MKLATSVLKNLSDHPFQVAKIFPPQDALQFHSKGFKSCVYVAPASRHSQLCTSEIAQLCLFLQDYCVIVWELHCLLCTDSLENACWTPLKIYHHQFHLRDLVRHALLDTQYGHEYECQLSVYHSSSSGLDHTVFDSWGW